MSLSSNALISGCRLCSHLHSVMDNALCQVISRFIYRRQPSCRDVTFDRRRNLFIHLQFHRLPRGIKGRTVHSEVGKLFDSLFPKKLSSVFQFYFSVCLSV